MNDMLQEPRAVLETTGRPSLPVLETRFDAKPVGVILELQSPSSLLAVLTTVARLGCRLTHVRASGREAALRVLAPHQVAHRVVPCLGQVIEVLSVQEGLVGLDD